MSNEKKNTSVSYKMFGAIDVGSYEINLKIFEISNGTHKKEVDFVRYPIDLGSDSFAHGKLSGAKIDELCKVLKNFSEIMKSYRVIEYKAYGTSAIRELKNRSILLDQIEKRTGIRIEVLSNSEQRFLDYKSIASKGESFNKIIEKGTAILDVGGGSIQISLFDKDTLVATQNLKLGVLRLRESLTILQASPTRMESLLDEIIDAQLMIFKKMYLKDREIENIIIVDDYVSVLLQNDKLTGNTPGFITWEDYNGFLQQLRSTAFESLINEYDIAKEDAYQLFISAILIKKSLQIMNAKLIWAPGVTLCDGIAYEYGEKHNLLKSPHDFEEDIIACAGNISRRYMGSKRRSHTLDTISMTIFDALSKKYGLDKRDRLLLRIAALLHDCGKYISMYNLGECSYNIIMATEIIGLSHEEREIVANVVKFNHCDFEYYEQIAKNSMMDADSYRRMARMTAILRVANGLDRSHKEKFSHIFVKIKDNELQIVVNTNEDITLEKGLFYERADFFEEVYGLIPVIRQKKEM